MAKTQMANRVRVLVRALQGLWEATSFDLDKLQSNPACAEQNVEDRHKPAWKLTYEPHPPSGCQSLVLGMTETEESAALLWRRAHSVGKDRTPISGEDECPSAPPHSPAEHAGHGKHDHNREDFGQA